MLPQDPNDPKLARPPQNKKNELVRLQSEITNEVTRDAPHIAAMVFGDAKDHPDVVGVPNERLDQVYRDAFLREDRSWLQTEARRDPDQFLKVTQRIGVRMPDPNAPPAPAPAPAPMPVPQPPPPVVPPVAPLPQPMPLAPGPMPGAAPVAPAPVILGPNGQPLPPTGLV